MAVLEIKSFSIVDVMARLVVLISWLTAVRVAMRPSVPTLKKVCGTVFLLTLAEMAFLFVAAVVIAALRAAGVAIPIEEAVSSRSPTTAYALVIFTLFRKLLVMNAIVLAMAYGLCRWAEESESGDNYEGCAKMVV